MNFHSIAIVFFLCNSLVASAASLTAKMDSAHIGLGRQTAVHLTLTQPKDQDFELQVEKDSTGKVDVVKLKKADTLDKGGSLEIKQDVIITSFDSGSCVVPPFKYVNIKTGETLTSEPLALEVNNDIEIKLDEAGQPDSTSVKDIKDIMTLGFDWGKFFTILLIILLIAVLGFLGWKYGWPYIQKTLAKKKGEGIVHDEPEIVLPIDVVAINKLDEIKAKRIWKDSTRIKEYYTDVTETLREYFCSRFNISAMEMTSDEILDELRYNTDAMPIIPELKSILSKADMAKFAKAIPTEEDCEMSLANAYLIVSRTKPVYTEPAKDKKSKKEEAPLAINSSSNNLA
ncbi:MAG: hypothetical protein UH071_08905 [Paludibacteraceae bacterium]|nr:hypothetical protein [Paludibacteraceae bacterium]